MRAMEYTPVQCRCQPIGQWTLLLLCLIHGPQIEPTKKLTDAECAAEYWRAYYLLARPLAANASVPTPEWDRALQEATTWQRFAIQPHASEVEA